MTPSQPPQAGRPNAALDRALGALLAVGVVLYVATLPRNLAVADESYFLVEAKRLLHGELLYRDLFWFAGPLAHWLMAAAFAVFGVSVNVARLAMAVLQGGLAALFYLSARRVGVRPLLALAPPLLHVAFCWSPFPYATPHWFSTLMMAAILYALLAPDRAVRPARAVLPGLFTGALALTHQQQGAVFAVAVSGLCVLDAALARRSGATLPPRTWWHVWLWYALGITALAGPVILLLLWITGPSVLFEQTILHPLTGYRAHNRAWWGAATWPPFAAYTWPALLRYAPLALLPALVRLAIGWQRRAPFASLQPLATLLVIGLAAMLSVSYMPDLVHVGFIATLLFVAGAEALEALLRRLAPRPALAIAGAALLVVVLLGGAAAQLARNHRQFWADNPYPVDTLFGRIDFPLEADGQLVGRLNALMADEPSRRLFVYPLWTSVYLTTDTENPTGHQFFVPGYNSEAEIDRALAALNRGRPPYVLVMHFPFLRPDDRIMTWIRAHYDAHLHEARFAPPYTIYRRRAAAAPAAG